MELNSLLWELNGLTDPFEEEKIWCLLVKKTHGARLSNLLKCQTPPRYYSIEQKRENCLSKIEVLLRVALVAHHIRKTLKEWGKVLNLEEPMYGQSWLSTVIF